MEKYKSLTDEEFKEIRNIVFNNIGVNLVKRKKALIVSRLDKRVKKLNLFSFSEYINFLKSNPEELEILFNLITTNVTKFFREEKQFEYLQKIVLPEIERKNNKIIRCWSAGCSTGEEPYSIALVLYEYFNKKEWKIEITASDINTEVLKMAEKGIYSKEKVLNIPYNLLTKHFKMGVGKNSGFFKIKKHVRKIINFQKINLTTKSSYPFKKALDFIFCRNVFIYFDNTTQEIVLSKFYDNLKEGSKLFLGHSERVNLNNGTNKGWELCVPTIYKKK